MSTGKAAKDVIIPSGLVGESLSVVESTLQDLNLKYKVEKELSEDVEVGKVITQAKEALFRKEQKLPSWSARVKAIQW